MKKILALIGSFGLISSATGAVISCGLTLKLIIIYTDLSDSNNNLQLIKRLDFDKINLDDLREIVQEELSQLINNKNSFGVKIIPKEGIDYTIETNKFNDQGLPITPDRILVSATPNSRYLTNSYQISLYKDLQFLAAGFELADDYDIGQKNLQILKDGIENYVPLAKLDVDYTLAEQQNGSWQLNSTDEGLLQLHVNFISFPYDLTQIEMSSVKVNSDMESVISSVARTMQTINSKIALNEDYEIIGSTEIGDSVIKVQAKPGSRRLANSFEISVLKESLADLTLSSEFSVATSDDEINEAISAAIKKLNPNIDAKSGTDFTFKRVKDEQNYQTKIEVNATIKSNFLTRTKLFALSKINLDNQFIKLDSDFFGKKIEDLRLEINDWINSKILNHQAEISDADYILVPNDQNPRLFDVVANKTSFLITGKLKLEQQAFDLNNLISDSNLTELFVGDDLNAVIEKVLDPLVRFIPQLDSTKYLEINRTENLQRYAQKQGVVTIKPTLEIGSEFLTGEIKLTIKPKSINQLQFENPLSVVDLPNINQLILNKIQILFTEVSGVKVTNDDFEIFKGEQKITDLATNWVPGTYLVKNSLTSKIISGEFSFNINYFEVDSSLISVEDIEVGDNYQTQIEKIIETIEHQISPKKLQLHQDYEILDSTNQGLEKGTITFRILDRSNLIKLKEGQPEISFEVKPKALTNLSLTFDETETWSTVINTVQAEIQTKLFGNDNPKIKPAYLTDFVIQGKDNSISDDEYVIPGEYIVLASPNSKVIFDEFTISITTKNIDQIKLKENNLSFALSEASQINDLIITKIKALFKNEIKITNSDFNVIFNDQIVDLRIKENWKAGTYFVQSNSNYFTGQFSFTIDPFEFSNETIGFTTLEVGDNLADQITLFKEKIESQIPGIILKENEDYIIDDQSMNATKAGIVTITGTKTRIVGQASFEVKPKAIDQLSFEFPSQTWKELHDNLLESMQKTLFAKTPEIKLTLADFEIQNPVGSAIAAGGTYQVVAQSSSNKITGAFKIHVGPLQVDNSWFTLTDLEVGDNLTEYINENILTIIQNHFGISTVKLIKGVDYDFDDETKDATVVGTVNFKILATSELIAPSKEAITFKVNPKSITDLTLKEVIRPGNLGLKANQAVKKELNALFENTNIEVNERDFAIFDSNNQLLTDDAIILGSTYKVELTAIGQTKMTGTFSFTVEMNDITSLEQYFVQKNYSILDSSLDIENEIETQINQLVNKTIEPGIDYEITGTADISDLVKKDPLSVGNTITVSAKDTGYLKGSFTFEIKKVNLKDLLAAQFGTLLAKMSKEEINEQILSTLKQATNNKVKANDFDLGTTQDWIDQNGKIMIQAASDSHYLMNKIEVQINKIDLEQYVPTFKRKQYVAHQTSWLTVKEDVQAFFDAEFSNAWKPVEYDVDYNMSTTRNDLLKDGDTLSSTASVPLKATDDSIMISGELIFADVQGYLLADGSTLYDGAGTNYLLTSKGSTYMVDSSYDSSQSVGITLENTVDKPLSDDNVYGVSNYFLVTDFGLYFGPKMISEPITFGLGDLIAINDNFVITTKGSWIWNDVSSTDPNSWTASKISELDDLTIADYLFISENLIVTTIGVFAISHPENRTQSISLVPLTIIPKEVLTKDNLIYLSDRLIITKNQIWYRTNLIDSQFEEVENLTDLNLTSVKDFVELSNDLMIIKDYGIIKWSPINSKMELIKDKNIETELLFKNENYIVTQNNIYYSNPETGNNPSQSEVNLTLDDILGINNKFVITTQGIYYEGIKIERTIFDTLTKDELIDFNERFVLTTKGSQYLGNTENAFYPTTGASFAQDADQLRTTDTYYLTKNFLIIIGRGSWYVDGETNRLIVLKYGVWGTQRTISAREFTAINDYFLITSFAVWSYDNSGAFGELTAKGINANEIVLLQDKVLVTTRKGIYYGKQLYAGSNGRTTRPIVNWLASDFLIFGKNGQIVTKYKSWRHWQSAPIITS